MGGHEDAHHGLRRVVAPVLPGRMRAAKVEGRQRALNGLPHLAGVMDAEDALGSSTRILRQLSMDNCQ